MTANFQNIPRAQPSTASRLEFAFKHWARLAADDLGFRSDDGTCRVRTSATWWPSRGRVANVTAGGSASWVNLLDACIWAALIDDESTRAIAVTMTHAISGLPPDVLALRSDLAVAADHLLTRGDERGEWLARWLMPDGPERTEALAECEPAITQAMAGLVARRLPKSDYAGLEQRVAAMYERAIKPPDHAAIARAATLHEADFFDRLSAWASSITVLPCLGGIAADYAATALTIAVEPHQQPATRARVSADVLRLLTSEAQR